MTPTAMAEETKTAQPAASEMKTSGKADVIESFNPATGEKLGEVKLSTAEDVSAAATRARAALPGWIALGVAGRNRILNRLKQVMLDRAEEIAEIVSKENGKPPCEAATMILPICAAIDYYTKLARKYSGSVKVSTTRLFLGGSAKVFYEPRGVAGFIMPWNFPFELGTKHMIPALAAGNVVIQKPSEFNPLIGELIASLYKEAGVPDGVVQIVHGYADVGAAIIDNSDIVCFIGSPGTGKRIMARASERLIPVILELGGNDAAIVRADADIDKTARGIVTGACLNAGQTCVSVERIYVNKAIVDKFTEKVVEYASKLKQNTGDGDYDIGPIKWRKQREIYDRHMKDARDKGAQVKFGGEVIEANGGLFCPPTVLTNVTHDMEMMKDETFGPFIPIMSVDNDEQALKLANDSQYGLGGSVWTADSATGEELARKIRTGSVMINGACASAGCPTLPFGGDGHSGVGRALGEMGYLNYTSPRSILKMPGGPGGQLGWMPYPKGSRDFIIGLARGLYSDSLGKKISGFRAAMKAFKK